MGSPSLHPKYSENLPRNEVCGSKQIDHKKVGLYHTLRLGMRNEKSQSDPTMALGV